MDNPPPRVLDLEGVHNFRDYGGYAVAGGGRLRRGMLWRSGEQHDATDDDLGRIAALGLAAVFDLRSRAERDVRPCRRPPGFAAKIHYSASPEVPRAAPHVEAARSSGSRDAAATREAMRHNYHRIAFRPELVAMVGELIAHVGGGGGPSLVHCMAGKDRTGIAVAMVQLAAGVHADDVIADYLLTNEAGNLEARIAAGAASITALRGKVDEEVLRVLMGVEAEYLESALAVIAERHGSVDGYLDVVVGIDAGARERLRAVLVEG